MCATPVPQRSGQPYSDGRVATIVQSGSVVSGPVVVGDDHVEPERVGACDLGDRRDPAVDREDEVDAVLRELLDRLRGEPVALFEAAREAPLDVRAELAQRQKRDDRRRDAVDVVVAVDADSLPLAHREVDPLDRRGHVAEAKGVVARRLRVEKRARRGGIVEAATDEHRRGGVAQPELSREGVDPLPVARFRRPAAVLHGPVDGTGEVGRCLSAPVAESSGRSLTRSPGRVYRRW